MKVLERLVRRDVIKTLKCCGFFLNQHESFRSISLLQIFLVFLVNNISTPKNPSNFKLNMSWWSKGS